MAIRVTERAFPDVNQVGIATGIVINQSRITFSGQRGFVLVLWNIRFDNPAAVAIDNANFRIQGTASSTLQNTHGNSMPAVANSVVQGLGIAVIIDPAEGSVLEVATNLSGGTVTLQAGASTVHAFSFEHGVGEGPRVTVS